jgi:hypothetical protein
LSTKNQLACPDANPGRRGGKTATNRLSYGTVFGSNLGRNIGYAESEFSWFFPQSFSANSGVVPQLRQILSNSSAISLLEAV